MTKILVVEDDHALGEMIKDMLEFNGYEPLVSRKPLETAENIINNDIDVVLVDKLMSGVDGTDVVADLRENEATKDIPVIMMTALSNARQVCMEAGATEFISKPFEMEDLIAKIEKIKK